MHKVFRSWIVDRMDGEIKAAYPGVVEAKGSINMPVGYARGVVYKRVLKKDKVKKTLFIAIVFRSDRAQAFPFIAWSNTGKLPDDDYSLMRKTEENVNNNIVDALTEDSGFLVGNFQGWNVIDPYEYFITENYIGTNWIASADALDRFLASDELRNYVSVSFKDIPKEKINGEMILGYDMARLDADWDVISGFASIHLTEDDLESALGWILPELRKFFFTGKVPEIVAAFTKLYSE